MDERGQSLTLNLESGDPFNPSREDENPTARNVVEFYLTFFGIKNLELDGWQNHAAKRIEMLKHRPDGPIYVTITGRDELVKFTADNASIIHSQAKRKAAE